MAPGKANLANQADPTTRVVERGRQLASHGGKGLALVRAGGTAGTGPRVPRTDNMWILRREGRASVPTAHATPLADGAWVSAAPNTTTSADQDRFGLVVRRSHHVLLRAPRAGS